MFAYCNNNPTNQHDQTGYASSTSEDINDNGIPDYLEIRWVEMSNRYRCVLEGASPRDVTAEVDAALDDAVFWLGLLHCFAPTTAKIVFYFKVDDKASWDIKRPAPWEKTIGTEYPGSSDTVVIYHGHYYTPEILGNYTYGIIGKTVGFSRGVLLLGSYYAARFPDEGTLAYDNEMLDWLFIAVGYSQ